MSQLVGIVIYEYICITYLVYIAHVSESWDALSLAIEKQTILMYAKINKYRS